MQSPLSVAGYVTDVKQFAAWLVATFILIAGIRFAKELIVFAMEKMYEIFIQHKAL